MSKALLITRPNYDSATNYLYHWSKKVITEAVKKQIPVYDLNGEKANKSNFQSFLRSKRPRFLFLNGHTVDEANQRSKQAMIKNFRKMISSDSTFEERFTARWLWSNIRSQVLWGNKDTRL